MPVVGLWQCEQFVPAVDESAVVLPDDSAGPVVVREEPHRPAVVFAEDPERVGVPSCVAVPDDADQVLAVIGDRQEGPPSSPEVNERA